MISNDPFISDEIVEKAATCDVGDGRSGFECDFHYDNNEISHGMDASAFLHHLEIDLKTTM